MPKISVIIPCFNLGKYITEAIDSVMSQTFQDFEIIVVNDGSTESETIEVLSKLNDVKIRVINVQNNGPSKARNIGISQSLGKYILPLDADDKIASSYIEKAIELLDINNNVGIVYCDAELFGENTGEWKLPNYEFSKFLFDNMIFCTAVYRKEDWQKAGGYNENMIYGWEDYDFWLSIIKLGRDVKKIPEKLFFYRKRSSSRTDSMTDRDILVSYNTIFNNHKEFYLKNIDLVFEQLGLLKIEGKNLRTEILKLKEEKSFFRNYIYCCQNSLTTFIKKVVSIIRK